MIKKRLGIFLLLGVSFGFASSQPVVYAADSSITNAYIVNEEEVPTVETAPAACSDDELFFAAVPERKYNANIATVSAMLPAIRNQGSFGTCWAFASTTLAELDLMQDGAVTRTVDFSDLHMAYYGYHSAEKDLLGNMYEDRYTYYNTSFDYLMSGGNFEMAAQRYFQWYGPVSESILPYSSASSKRFSLLPDSYAFNNSQAHIKNAYKINIKTNPELVKAEIKNHGAVGMAYYHLDSAEGVSLLTGEYTYYNSTVHNTGGHAVVIVGWDDDYSTLNFPAENRPSQNGAWLVRNSWGNNFSYFWMPYETVDIVDEAWSFDFEMNDGYQNNYQYDGTLTSYTLNVKKGANVYTVNSKQNAEDLKAVVVSFTHAANVQYTIRIYTNLTGIDPTSGSLVASATTSGVTTCAGIYTIPLVQPVILQANSKFAVEVTVDKENAIDHEQNGPLDIINESGIKLYTIGGGSIAGQSFYYLNNKYNDFGSLGSFRIKALTSNRATSVIYQNGWNNLDGKWYYYSSGKKCVGWKKLNNYYYYFDGNGVMVTGFSNIEGKTYYFGTANDGAMKVGWQHIGGKWYYMNSSGAMTTGWQLVGGIWYYMNNNGVMTTGRQYIDGKWYYMNSSGAMTTGWQQIGGAWYYMNSSGAMTTGWQYVGGKWYYMNSSGVMTTGWQLDAGKWYYMNSSGTMTTGWQQIGGTWYYMNSSGAMTTGWQYVGSKWYYMNSSGAMTTGWQYVGGRWYYMNSSGAWVA